MAKTLTWDGLLISRRGAYGGYRLVWPVAEIRMVDIVESLEGLVAIMECIEYTGTCWQESVCRVRGKLDPDRPDDRPRTGGGDQPSRHGGVCGCTSLHPRRRRAEPDRKLLAGADNARASGDEIKKRRAPARWMGRSFKSGRAKDE